MNRFLKIAGAIIFFGGLAFGQTGNVVNWDFNGENQPIVTSTADSTASNISTSSPSGVVSWGSGVTQFDLGGQFGAIDWKTTNIADAKTNNDYLTFTITPATGYGFSVDSVKFYPFAQNQRNLTWELRSSIDGFASTIATYSNNEICGNCPLQNLTVTGHSNLKSATEFRIYIYGDSINEYETYGITNEPGNDLIVSGNVELLAPVFTQQPVPSSITVDEGQSATFTVAVSKGNVTWFKNGVSTGVTGLTFTKSQLTVNDSGSYSAQVQYDTIVVNSAPAHLAVTQLIIPQFVTNPVSKTAFVGDLPTFFAKASGTEPITYQWRKDGLTYGGNLDSSVIPAVTMADSGAVFDCIATNRAGADTSLPGVLTVKLRPAFSRQPVSAIREEKDSVSFTVAVSSSSTWTVIWFKNGVATGATGLTYKIPSIALNDSGSYTARLVSDGFTVNSSAAYLTVKQIFAPQFTLNPSSKTVFVGDPAMFIVRATGTEPLTYQWRKNGIATTTTDDTIIIPATTLADSGAVYDCIVMNKADTIVSLPGLLLVKSRPRANFNAAPLDGIAPVNVIFTDASTGEITSWKWVFGDGNSATTKNTTHTYDSSGQYSVSLIIEGPGGRDTSVKQIHAYKPGANPVRIAGKYLSATRIEITLSALNLLDTSFLTSPWADSLRVLIKDGAIPTDLSPGTALPAYRYRGKSTIIDTITIAPITDTILGLANTIFRKDGKQSTITAANTFSILMKDTVVPSNPLMISGKYAGRDSAFVYIDSCNKIDSTTNASVLIWFGYTNNSNFTDQAHTKAITVTEILKSAANGRFTFSLKDQSIYGQVQPIFVAVAIKGKNLLISKSRPITSFTVGVGRPINNATLQANAISSSKIELMWSGTADADSVKVWYSTKPVPIGEWIFSTSTFLNVKYSSNKGIDTIVGLNQNTRYHFALQVFKDGLASLTTVTASATDSTPQSLVPYIGGNTIVIRSAYFDTLSNKLVLTCTPDTSGIYASSELDIGVVTGFNDYPIVQPSPGVGTIFTTIIAHDSLRIEINLSSTIVFDTTYYIALWLKNGGGAWMTPTSKSMDTVKTKGFTWQKITYFNPAAPFDTVRAFNDTVSMWSGTYQVPSTDSLVLFRTTRAPGLIPVSQGFKFTKKDPGPAFYVGIHYDKSLIPTGISAADLRMYRPDVNGNWAVEMGSKVIVDKHLVYVMTSKLDKPFIIMADTQAPTLICMSDTGTALDPGSTFYDTTVLKDNIINMKWTYLYGKGEDSPSLRSNDTGTLSSAIDTLYTTIPSNQKVVTEDNGVRIWMIVTDGVHIDTLDLSRRVKRSQSDPVSISSLEWTPIYATANLTQTSAESTFIKLSGQEKWTYDPANIRLFTWQATPSNKTSINRWVEYADSVRNLFTFTPGKVLWVKTRDKYSVDLGKAVTMSLKEPATITLNPQDWTDFSLPFRFDIRINDILKATALPSDTLQICQWSRDSITRFYSGSLIYMKDFPEKANRNDTLFGKGSDGYTIYNPLSTPITLRIPALPVSMSTSVASLKKGTDLTWCVKLVSHNEKRQPFPDVYLGYKTGSGTPAFYPAPPSFLKTRVGVYDRKLDQVWGHEIVHTTLNGGYAYELAFDNASDENTSFTYEVSTINSLPSGMNVALLDPTTMNWNANGTVGVNAGDRQYRWLIAGNDAFMDGFKKSAQNLRFNLGPVYPNPFASAVRVQYSVPMQENVRMIYSIFDAQGRLVIRNSLNSSPGAHVLSWNARNNAGKRVSAGIYILRVTAIATNGKIRKQMETRLSCLPR